MNTLDFEKYLADTPGARRAWNRLIAIAPNVPSRNVHCCPLDPEADDPNAGGWFFSWTEGDDQPYVDIEVPVDGPIEWFARFRGGDAIASGEEEYGVRFAVAFVLLAQSRAALLGEARKEKG